MTELREEELEEIIRRLRREVRVPEQRAAFDWRRVRREFEAARGALAAIGRAYARLEAPILSVAKSLSQLTLAKGLSRELACAGIAMSAEMYLVATAATALIILLSISLAIVLLTFATPLQQLGAAIALPSGAAAALFTSLACLIWPSLVAKGRALALDRELPFALRQLATQTRAGVSLVRAFASIAKGGYGILSDEMRTLMHDLDVGLTTEAALLRLSERTRSIGLRRAIIQLVRALRTGGSIADVLTAIASDVAFDIRMRIREFVERLNLLAIGYIIVAIVAPVAAVIISSTLQLPIFAGMVSSEAIVAFFMLDLVAMGALVALIVKFEPGS